MVADPADDRAEDLRQVGADHQESLGVGLGRSDLQQRHELPGGGQAILHQAVVAELEELFDADAGRPQDLDRGPSPEGVIVLQAQITPLGGQRVVRPHLAGDGMRGDRADQSLPSGGEGVTGLSLAGGPEQSLRRLAPLVDGAHEGGEDRKPFAGAGVHA